MAAASLTDVTFTIPSWSEICKVLLLQAGFNSAVVVIGTTCLGLAAGIVGTFSLLRKRALIGDALSHAALPGLAAAYIIANILGHDGRDLTWLLGGAALSGILGVFCIQILVQHTRLREDAAIGIILSTFFGAGIVLLSYIQNLGTGSEGGLHHFIYGQTAAMQPWDAYVTGAIALLAATIAVLMLKEFRLVCFDHEYARAQGWSINLIDAIMMSLLVVVSVTGLQAVGILLIVALLIVPAAAARFWSEKLHFLVILSAMFGGMSGYFGSVASSLLPRLPAGAVIVLTAGIIFSISFLFAPRRGVVAAFLRRVNMTFAIGRDHILRELYEIIEVKKDDQAKLRIEQVRTLRGYGRLMRNALLIDLKRKGFVATLGSNIYLLPTGLAKARRLTKSHRLWEEYVLRNADLAASHVDYSADFVEHVLSPELVDELEAALREKGIFPDLVIPDSPHPILISLGVSGENV